MTETERIVREYERRSREIPADFYSLSKPANVFAYTQRLRATVQLLARKGLYPPAGQVICEVGCGTGRWLVDFVNWGAHPECIRGIDLDEQRITIAQGAIGAGDLRVGYASDLPWQSNSCNLVLQSTMFTSILDPAMKRRIAAEMVRVVRPDGMILWYDFRFNNPRNPHVRGIEAAEIRSLFPGCLVELHRVTLAPPIARAVVPFSWLLALLLEKIPLLRTHYLGVIRKA